jgi:predicted GH43/DUF377 family glycosyl hydrolase
MNRTLCLPAIVFVASCSASGKSPGDAAFTLDAAVESVVDAPAVADAIAVADALAVPEAPSATHMDAGIADAVFDVAEGDVAAPDPCGAIGDTFQRCARNPLVTAGRRHSDGTMEIVIADPSVLYDEDEKTWKAWWQSPLAMSYAQADAATSILYSESRDGITWVTQEAPVLSAHADKDAWDWDRVETPSVVKVASNPPDRRYVLYYSGANLTATPTSFDFPWYQLGVAFSADGKKFTRLPAAESPYAGKATPYAKRDGLLLLGRDAFPAVVKVKDGLVADPEVVVVGRAWHLFFSSMAIDENNAFLSFGVGHATSDDGVHWTVDAKNPVLPGQQPAVVWNSQQARFEAFLNADSDTEKLKAPSTFNPQVNVTWYTSPDGSTFTPGVPERVFSWDGSLDTESHGWLTGAAVVRRADGYWLFYSAWGMRGVGAGFVVPVRTDWCASAAHGCTCEAGSCWVASVTSLNLARRRALP